MAEDRWKEEDDIQEIYRQYGPWLHRFEPLDRLVFGRSRRHHFSAVRGRVLDVACGTDTNFPYLDPSIELVGIDLSETMLDRASRRLARLKHDGTLIQMDSGNLGFSDDTFDVVISALSTCTFPDPVGAVEEMARVCSDDGRILLLEHGKSDIAPLARFQDRFDETHYERMGCRWTHHPVEHVTAAGLEPLSVQYGPFGIITRIETSPSGSATRHAKRVGQ